MIAMTTSNSIRVNPVLWLSRRFHSRDVFMLFGSGFSTVAPATVMW